MFKITDTQQSSTQKKGYIKPKSNTFNGKNKQSSTQKRGYIKPCVTKTGSQYRVRYQNNDGLIITFTTDAPVIAKVFEEVGNYIDHGITTDEQEKMTDAVYKAMGPHNYNEHGRRSWGSSGWAWALSSYGSQILDDYDRLVRKYSKDGSCVISVDNAIKLIDLWHQWTSKTTQQDIQPEPDQHPEYY